MMMMSLSGPSPSKKSILTTHPSPPQKLEETAAKNRETNAATRETWIGEHSMHQIRTANRARMRLRNKFGVTSVKLTRHDPRLPKAIRTSFTYFVKDRYRAPELADLDSKEKFRAIGAEWKKLSEGQRKVRFILTPREGLWAGEHGRKNEPPANQQTYPPALPGTL